MALPIAEKAGAKILLAARARGDWRALAPGLNVLRPGEAPRTELPGQVRVNLGALDPRGQALFLLSPPRKNSYFRLFTSVAKISLSQAGDLSHPSQGFRRPSYLVLLGGQHTRSKECGGKIPFALSSGRKYLLQELWRSSGHISWR